MRRDWLGIATIIVIAVSALFGAYVLASLLGIAS
jgi:hypothetical protein